MVDDAAARLRARVAPLARFPRRHANTNRHPDLASILGAELPVICGGFESDGRAARWPRQRGQ